MTTNICPLIVFEPFYLAQVHFVEVPLLFQSTDTNVAVFSVQEQSLINVPRCAFQFLSAQVLKKQKTK